MPVCAQLKMHIALLIEDFGDDLSVEEQMCLPESFAYVGIQKKKSMGNILHKDLNVIFNLEKNVKKKAGRTVAKPLSLCKANISRTFNVAIFYVQNTPYKYICQAI